MVNARRKALEMLWKDRCSIYKQEEHTDPVTKLTDFQETPLLEDQPCKLSFEKLISTDGDPAGAVGQSVKLFISPDVVIPAGCKVVVTRYNPDKTAMRVFVYASSGEPGVFTYHQEITLELWKEWA